MYYVVTKCLLWWSRVMDHQVWLIAEIDSIPFLGRRLFSSCPLPLSWGCLWFGLAIQTPSLSAIAMDAAMGPITMIMPSPKQIPLLGQGTAAPCTLWILGRWVGPTTLEVQLHVQLYFSVWPVLYIIITMTNYYILLSELLLLTIVITLLLHYCYVCYYIIITNIH